MLFSGWRSLACCEEIRTRFFGGRLCPCACPFGSLELIGRSFRVCSVVLAVLVFGLHEWERYWERDSRWECLNGRFSFCLAVSEEGLSSPLSSSRVSRRISQSPGTRWAQPTGPRGEWRGPPNRFNKLPADPIKATLLHDSCQLHYYEPSTLN